LTKAMQIKPREYQLLKEVAQLREELGRLQKTNRDLQVALTTATESGNVMTAQLCNTNRQLEAEIQERRQRESSLAALVELICEHQEDLDVILQAVISHSANQHGTSTNGRLQASVAKTADYLTPAIDGAKQFADRRRFDDYLEQQWRQMANQRSVLTVMLISISGIPPQTTQCGVLDSAWFKQIAAVFDRTIKRSADLTACYGASEFAVILPRTTVNGARILAKQLQAGIAALQVPQGRSNSDAWMTLSISIASTQPAMNRSLRLLINEAARLLDLAKQRGTNQILHVFLD
jgi:diguanylate cyclase (GGDEF)-like protein